MRSESPFIASVAAAALAIHATAAVTYQSSFRELSVERTTFQPAGVTQTTSDLGSFVRASVTQRFVPWMGVFYQVFASASIDSEMNASGMSAIGSLAASGIPASAQFPPEIKGIARIEMSATFTVDIDTPFNLTASTFSWRAADRFGIELKDSSGNNLVLIDKSSPPGPISFDGTLTPGQYSFHYLAELNSGTYAKTDYSVAFTIPAPASILLGCLLPPVTRRRPH